MTTLVVDALKTVLTQDFIVDLNRRYTIEGIRPYLNMYNSPAGTFTLSVLDSDTNVLVSQTFTSAEIKSDLSTSDDYAYLWKRIVFDNPLHLSKGTYTLKLSSSGYTYSDSSYLSWIREHENIFNTTDGLNDHYTNNPFSFQIFENRSNTL